MEIKANYSVDNEITLYQGDCMDLLKEIPDETCDLIITSPPYCIGKEYEDRKKDLDSFVEQQKKTVEEIYRILKVGASVCWQVGYHVADQEIIPLDFYVYQVFSGCNNKHEIPLKLRNRIIWTFGHGLNPSKRFSGRHETILWFTKGEDYTFDLDSIRIPQKYPGKRAYRGNKKGEFSGNPLGKNPTDVWDIPNVKANHVEKTEHPCQFPVAIPSRFIRALTPLNGVILDPYTGSGTTGVAAVLEGRRFIGAEIKDSYYEIAKERIQQAIDGTVKVRPDVPICEPDPSMAVAKLPEEFRKAREEAANGGREKK